MSQFSYKALLKGETVVKETIKKQTNSTVTTVTKRSFVDSTHRNAREEYSLKKSVLNRILKRLGQRRLRYAFSKLKHMKLKHIHLDVIQNYQQKLMVYSFTKLLQFCKPSLKAPVELSTRQSKILPLFLVKIIKSHQGQCFNQITRYGWKKMAMKNSLHRIFLIQNRIKENIISSAFSSFKTAVTTKAHRDSKLITLCYRIQKFVIFLKTRAFQSFIFCLDRKAFHLLLHDKAQALKSNNKLASSRMNRVNQGKQELKITKNELQIQSGLRHRRATEIQRSLNNQKYNFQEEKKKFDKLIQSNDYRRQESEEYLKRLIDILEKRKQLTRRAKGMQKRVLDMYENIEKSKNINPKNIAANPSLIFQKDQYHLYINQKLRMTISIYERDMATFEKWDQDHKMIKQNTELKTLIKSIISRIYQGQWVFRFLEQI